MGRVNIAHNSLHERASREGKSDKRKESIMAKVVQIQVVEAAGGKGVEGAKIKVDGSATEQLTNQDGVTQFLLDDGDVSIQVNGAPAYKGAVGSLKQKEIFTKAGQRLAA
jgi:hypothetical protein